jgi:catechol 2,3-dioxygenase-like lactoylglutathione lyase family enzyme
MSIRVDHHGLTVADLDASVAFFTEVLGFTEERRAHLTGPFAADVVGVPGADIRTAVLALDGSRLELLAYASPAAAAAVSDGPEVPGSMHLAFAVDDLPGIVAAAAPYGWAPPGRPATMSAGARAGTTFSYLRDDSGATVELIAAPR